ncbi:GNAT family N-acetyltransferase, partial [Mesorhizobium sp. M8A.F.Ca.ET.059.01.1.1]
MGRDGRITVQSSFGVRLARPEDLAAIVALTQAAYA